MGMEYWEWGIEIRTHLKCCTFDWSSFFLRRMLASTNGFGSGVRTIS